MADPRSLASRRAGPLSRRAPVSIGLLGTATRFAFRGSPEAANLCGRAFGCALPLEACRARYEGERAALWLGPDEWLLIAPERDGPALARSLPVAVEAVPHSLVDVSHRQVGFEVSGPGAEPLLNTGCPLDLGQMTFPVDMATRTVLAKADVTLWRRGTESFRLEAVRSYAPYVLDFLKAAEAGLG